MWLEDNSAHHHAGSGWRPGMVAARRDVAGEKLEVWFGMVRRGEQREGVMAAAWGRKRAAKGFYRPATRASGESASVRTI